MQGIALSEDHVVARLTASRPGLVIGCSRTKAVRVVGPSSRVVWRSRAHEMRDEALSIAQSARACMDCASAGQGVWVGEHSCFTLLHWLPTQTS